MVILERIAMLVHEEDARHVALGEGVMVTIVCQLATVQRLEVALLCVDLFHQLVARHTLVAHFAVLVGVVVCYHVEVKQVLYLTQWHQRMLGIPHRTAQVGILAREGDEVHVILRHVLGIVSRQRDDRRRARCIVVSTRVISLEPFG